MNIELCQHRDTLKEAVIDKIEAIVQKVGEDLSAERPLTLPIMSRRHTKPASAQVPSSTQSRLRQITRAFPGKDGPTAWRFAMAVFVLNLIHEALTDGNVISKRDIYYQDTQLFLDQTVVDHLVDDIAFTFEVPRSCLNVTAEAKGLVAGVFTFVRRDGSTTNAGLDTKGVVVPDPHDIVHLDLSEVGWILVIEKKASFHTLAQKKFYQGYCKNGIIVTAQGYPDILTRSFLRCLHNQRRSIPLYGLVDYDPDGLAIFSTYAYGSLSLPHENPALVIPSIRLLGLRAEDVSDSSYYGFNLNSSTDGAGREQSGLPYLTNKERGMASKMLGRLADESEFERDPDSMDSDAVDRGEHGRRELKRELQVMLILGVKAEIQVLDSRDGGLERWAGRKLNHY